MENFSSNVQMNAKLKLLSVVLAVISCVVVLSDSPASIQQIMGILIAIMILHFYLTRHFDDVIALSKDQIATKTNKFNIDKDAAALTTAECSSGECSSGEPSCAVLTDNGICKIEAKPHADNTSATAGGLSRRGLSAGMVAVVKN